MKTKQIIPLTLGLLLTGSLIVQAQDHRPLNPNRGAEKGFMSGQGRGQNFRATHFANGVQLTDEQKATLESLQEEHAKEVKNLRLEIEAKQAKQKTLVETVNPDSKMIDKNIDEIAKLEAQLAKSSVAFRVEVKKILPEGRRIGNGKGFRDGQGFGPGKMNGANGNRPLAKGNANISGHGNGQGSGRGNDRHLRQGNGQGLGFGNGYQPNRGMAMKGNCMGAGCQGNGMGMHTGMAQGQNFRGGMKGKNGGFAGHGNAMRQGGGKGMKFTLSNETKDLMQKNMLEVSAQTRDLRNQMNELHVKQKTLLSEDNVNLKDVNKNIDEIAKLKAKVMKVKVNARLNVLKQMTPEEREKVLLSKPFMHGQGHGFRK